MSKTAPVLNEHSSEDNHVTNEAISSGSPVLPIGILSTMYSTCFGVRFSTIRVLITAGVIQLTVIPVVANSLPTDFVSPITAAFDAE